MVMQIQARVVQQLKSDSEWKTSTTCVPLYGEAIIYSADAYNPVRFKLGDGVSIADSLPFISTEGLFAVNITTIVVQEVVTYIADKTFAQISAAVAGLKFVYALYDSQYYFCFANDASAAHFYCFTESAAKYVRVYSDNSVQVGQASIGGYTVPVGGIPASDLSEEVRRSLLPAVTTADNGKLLGVDTGEWSKVTLPSASGVSF